MANFYNPYMKGPDFGQGINQWMAQRRAMMMAMLGAKAGAQGDPTQAALSGGQSFYEPTVANSADAVSSAQAAEAANKNPLAALMSQQGSARTPTGGNMAGSPINPGGAAGTNGALTPDELVKVSAVFQQLMNKMKGPKGFGGF